MMNTNSLKTETMKTSNKNTEIFTTFKNANIVERRNIKNELEVIKNANKRVKIGRAHV